MTIIIVRKTSPVVMYDRSRRWEIQKIKSYTSFAKLPLDFSDAKRLDEIYAEEIKDVKNLISVARKRIYA